MMPNNGIGLRISSRLGFGAEGDSYYNNMGGDDYNNFFIAENTEFFKTFMM